MTTKDDGKMRSFDTGATRDTGSDKLDYEGFLSAAVLKQFAKFMQMNRLQSDGDLRDSDNWQKGIPMDVYMKSAYRHFHEWWEFHRQMKHRDRDGMVEGIGAMCGLMFNVMGYMHEWLKEHPEIDFDDDEPTFEMAERQMKIRKEEARVDGVLTLDEAVEQEKAECMAIPGNCDHCRYINRLGSEQPCNDCDWDGVAFWQPMHPGCNCPMCENSRQLIHDLHESECCCTCDWHNTCNDYDHGHCEDYKREDE